MKLYAARKASGKTQEQVAEGAKVTSRQYQHYEYGKHDPTVRTAIRISAALNSTVEALFNGEKKGE